MLKNITTDNTKANSIRLENVVGALGQTPGNFYACQVNLTSVCMTHVMNQGQEVSTIKLYVNYR